MRLILLGPPGAGKGTQADTIGKKLFLTHISTGDMFRAAMKAETPLGIAAKSCIEKGQLVSDEITIHIVKDRLQQADCKAGFLLDGFPRTLVQAEALDTLLQGMNIKLDAVINIVVDHETLIARLSGRRICRSCGQSYHMIYNPPQKEGVCDSCNGELYQRSDDREDAIKARLAVYDEQTAPLIGYYKKKGLLTEINGAQAIHLVSRDIGKAWGQNW